MISGLLKKIFGSRNDRLIKQYFQTVKRINALEPSLEALSNEQLRAKTEEFRQRHANGRQTQHVEKIARQMRSADVVGKQANALLRAMQGLIGGHGNHQTRAPGTQPHGSPRHQRKHPMAARHLAQLNLPQVQKYHLSRQK